MSKYSEKNLYIVKDLLASPWEGEVEYSVVSSKELHDFVGEMILHRLNDAVEDNDYLYILCALNCEIYDAKKYIGRDENE